MLWRVRTTLSDRPGSLATLALHCGEQGVNILGLQIFPGIGGVTDELVLRAPASWGTGDVAALVERAGGDRVSVVACTEHALVDGPIHYLEALRRVAHDPSVLAETVARLLDAEPVTTAVPTDAAPSSVPDHLAVEVGLQRVHLRRTTPFTATEHARAAAFAEIAEVLLAHRPEPSYDGSAPSPDASGVPQVQLASFDDTAALMRMHQRCSSDTIYRRYATPLTRVDERMARRLLLAGGGALVASVGDEVVGVVSIGTVEAGVAEVALLVEDGWQRRGLGTRLLSSAARLARGHGASDVVLRSHLHNPALMSLAFASGLRARIRLDGDAVVVTVGVEGLKPLTVVAAADPVPRAGQPAPA